MTITFNFEVWGPGEGCGAFGVRVGHTFIHFFVEPKFRMWGLKLRGEHWGDKLLEGGLGMFLYFVSFKKGSV